MSVKITRRNFLIQIQDRVNVNDLNAMSPLRLEVEECDDEATHLRVQSDQAGLIGLLRYLHSLGLTLLAVEAEENSA